LALHRYTPDFCTAWSDLSSDHRSDPALGAIEVTTDSYASRTIAFHCWLDIFERTDTLILEIRHVQETTASQLRIPDLYEIFQYEDHYLWGRYASKIPTHHRPSAGHHHSKDWFEVLNSHSLASFSHFWTVLAAVWCPEFPPASGNSVYYETLSDETDAYSTWFDKKILDEKVASWKKARVNIGTRNLFSANDDRLYDALRYLQLLKRDILRDKLVVAYRALESLGQLDKVHSRRSLPHFVMVRRAALYSLHRRLDGFRDILTTVQEILNLSMERDPPPTVWRRRDQGMYTTDLADSCRYIESNIRSYFKAMRQNNSSQGTQPLREAELEFIIHRYTRNYDSTNRYDSIWSKSDTGSQLSNIGAGFVQSSFWMPERPDLQPVIVHEIAHLLVLSHYGNLRPIDLDGIDDPFGKLLREVSLVFEQSSSKFSLYDFLPRKREGLLREIASDLVGIAMHGTSYLLASFLEIIGAGCERLFEATPTGDIAQNIDQLGEEYITYIRYDHPEWLARLSVALAFWNSTRRNGPQSVTHLESLVGDGISEVINGVHRQLSGWMDGAQRKEWENWVKMTNDLINIVEQSELCDVTASWLRSRDALDELGERYRPTELVLDRYLRPLSVEIKRSCLGAWLDRLVEAPRMLGTYLNESLPVPNRITHHTAVRCFRKLYLKPSVQEFQDDVAIESNLFSHLIDIPWQTAFLTVHDLLGTPPACRYGVSQEDWITAIHEFNWLGRDLYHSALEFVIWHERPSIGRLKAMNRWLLSIRDMMGNVTDNAIDPLRGLVSSILGDDLPDALKVRALSDGSRWLEAKLRPLFDRWTSYPDVVVEAIDVGSQVICRFYPEHDKSIIDGGDSELEKRWTNFFDWIATAQMNDACARISDGLVAFLNAEKNSDVVGKLALAVRRPMGSSVRRGCQGTVADDGLHLLYARIIMELVRVAHYLGIRPEISAAGPSIAHHKGGDKPTWNSVFAQYLDVPIHARKRECGENSTLIDGLLPVRSLRLDRFSQVYDVHVSSEAMLRGQHGTSCPGYLARDTLLTGRSLFWVPWDPKGVRRDGNSGEYYSTLLGVSLLGRFDRLTLDIAKHTARFSQNLNAGSASCSPFFRRQQIGLPFSASVDAVNRKINRTVTHRTLPIVLQTFKFDFQPKRDVIQIPLATVSILLVQRSARLTFVERLIAEDIVMKSFHRDLSSPYRYFDPERDVGLLTDGWGDMFLVLFADWNGSKIDSFDEYATKCEGVKARFDEIITFRKSVFEDTLVVRSETSYTPLGIDTALLHPDEFRSTISIRFRASLDGRSISDEFERHMSDVLDREYEVFYGGSQCRGKLSQLLSYSRTAGRTDYIISTKTDIEDGLARTIYKSVCWECKSYEAYGIIFETLRRMFFKPGSFIEKHVDSTATGIAELTFPKH
jgi:hypothetical protein